jgi:hypothetical protein
LPQPFQTGGTLGTHWATGGYFKDALLQQSNRVSEQTGMEQTLEKEDRTSGRDSQGAEQTGFIAGAAESLKDRAAEALRNTASDFAEAGKAQGAERIDRLGRAVHGAADQIGREIPQAADYVHSAADGLESAAAHLRNRSVEDLIGTFNRFARQQPLAAFAGAVLAGFVVSRFIKSSS